MKTETSSSFFNRSLKRVRTAWSEISTNVLGERELNCRPSLPNDDLNKMAEAIDRSLNAPGGEVSARKSAARIGRAYMTLDQTGRKNFFRLLASQYEVNEAEINRVISEYQQPSSQGDLPRLRHKLRNALLAPRVKLLTLFNTLPEGIKFLVDMRAELMALNDNNDADLHKVERDLKHLLTSWFDIGFLQLHQITWDSPASILEKLIEYEAVHEISSWDDLKNRLADDRRLFAFFHPNMPKEPLIFVHVALVKGLATNVQKLLDPNAPMVSNKAADTAIFYSISNAQQGLSGISFGNFLIKRVVGEAKKELPQLKQFATLSPIPGFRKWLTKQLGGNSSNILNETEKNILREVKKTTPEASDLLSFLNSPDWHTNQIISQPIKPILKRLCALYLTTQHDNGHRLLDTVAHFHSSNGAIIQQVNWLADTSPKGFSQSFGIMVNYLYALDDIDYNSEQYSIHHKATLSNELRQLLIEKDEWAN